MEQHAVMPKDEESRQQQEAVARANAQEERQLLARQLAEANGKIHTQAAYIDSQNRQLTRLGPLAAEAERTRGEAERAKVKAKAAESAKAEAERKAEQERFARLRSEEERDELAAEVSATTRKIEELAAGLASLAREE